MQRQMSGPPGAHVQSPVERGGRAVLESVLLPPSPLSVQDPCVRTGPATTQPSAPVSALFLPSDVSVTGGRKEKKCNLDNVGDTWSF